MTKSFGSVALATILLLALHPCLADEAASPETNPLVGEKSGIKADEPPQDAQWEPAWQKLCAYDDFCHRLKNPKDSSWLNPELLQVEILKQYRKDILKAAKLYGVDPRAIVGSFLADLTIIPTHEGEIHQFLVDKARGKNPVAQFPLGLVYPVAALPVEDLAAKIEKRKPRTPTEIESLLNTPQGTIYYGAAVIRDAQDKYLSHGFEISKQPEVLATLYNLGKVEPKAAALQARIKRANDMKTEGATPEDLAKAGLSPDLLKPRPNFFGVFLKKNSALIDEILDPSKDSEKNKTGAGSCSSEKTAAVAEFPIAQSLVREFKKSDLAALDQFTRAVDKKLQENIVAGKEIKDSDFENAVKTASNASPLCPPGSKLSPDRSGDFYCTFSRKSGGLNVRATYSVAFIEPANKVPAKIRVCYSEEAALSNQASVELASCARRDLGDLKNPAKLVTSSERLSGRESFYGQERIPVSSDPESYAAYSLPLQCFYTPASTPSSPDVRAEQRASTKAQGDSNSVDSGAASESKSSSSSGIAK